MHAFAYPILDELAMPATVFAPTDFIGAEAPIGYAAIVRRLDGVWANASTTRRNGCAARALVLPGSGQHRGLHSA